MFYTFYGRKGNNIFVRYKNEKGGTETFSKKILYEPSLYIKTNETPDKLSIFDEPLKKITFSNCYEAKETAKGYKDVDGIGLNGNSNYENQFIIDLFKGEPPEYDANKINIGMVDIEVDAPEFPLPDEAKWPINATALYSTTLKKFYSFALSNPNGDSWSIDNSPENIKQLDVQYEQFETETELIEAVFLSIKSLGIDIITGWNSDGFDVPYLYTRGCKIMGEAFVKSTLSPFNMIDVKEKVKRFGKKQTSIEIFGLPHLDYMDVYRKHTYTPRESYKLDYIAHVELGDSKIEYEGSLYELYRDDFQKFVDYNIQDVNIIKRLDEKLALFDLIYAMSYYSLSNYEDSMGTTAIWEKLIAKFLFNKNRVPLFSRLSREERDYEGAYVYDVKPGHYKWILSEDLNSLYPHCEMQWNIGIETHIPYVDLPKPLQKFKNKYNFNDLLQGDIDTSILKDHDVCMAPNFEFYKKDKMSFFSEIKREIYSERKMFKGEMIEEEKKKELIRGEMKKRGLLTN